MEQYLYIQGITCQNCREFVIDKINSIKGVTDVSLSLETGKAILKAEVPIPLNQLNDILGKKYTVLDIKEESISIEKKQESKLKGLFPLFLIFGYIISATFFLHYKIDASMDQLMLNFMGLFFIIFSFFKFLDYQGFSASFARYDPLAKRSPFYAKIYPFLETALGIAFLLSWELPIILGLTVIILSITTYGVLQSILKKSANHCACLGTVLKLPMTEATLIENGIMIVMSFILILGYTS